MEKKHKLEVWYCTVASQDKFCLVAITQALTPNGKKGKARKEQKEGRN
jgi:hypothetical protein